ncbi:TPA: pentapeptide repeat-containing protein [Campylobacter coli]|nr:pentapeptide repeat-containing protein [Campylobacter coli]HEG0348169.1 pentapeptide repeat-containing protein [Campylobacter coli]
MTNAQINDKILELANYLKIDNKCVAHNARLQSMQINGAVIKNFSFKLFNEYKLSFFNCKFLCEINEAPGFFEIENPVYIYDCTFEENVISYNIKFKSNVVIAYCRFNKNFYFEANTFCNSSNFERNFYNYASFKKSHFEKNVTFYNSTFKGLDFSQAIFNENLNIVNTKLNFTFSNLEEKIEQEYEEFNKNKKEEDQKSLDKFANDFRDSFRTFKSALIKDNNALDASNFHKYELYCKEIELKESWNKKGKNVSNMTDLETNVSRIRDFMDFLLLGFYRKLCDHHTDFLKVFNNLILLIALYALFVFGFTWLHDDKLEDTRAILTLFGFFDKFRLYFDIISTIFVVFGCGFFVCKLDSYEKKNNVSKKQNINFIYIIGDFLNLIKSLLFASFIPCVFYVLFSLFGFFLNLGKDFGYSLLINTLFVSLYICLVYTKSLFFGRYVVLIFSYIGFIIMLIKQPNVIHPLIGKIANESDKFFNYPSLIVLNILYTILLALVLFSLQKTARKNSIVPS